MKARTDTPEWPYRLSLKLPRASRRIAPLANQMAPANVRTNSRKQNHHSPISVVSDLINASNQVTWQ